MPTVLYFGIIFPSGFWHSLDIGKLIKRVYGDQIDKGVPFQVRVFIKLSLG